MSGEPVVQRVVRTPDLAQNLIGDLDRRVGLLERDSRKLASDASVIAVMTFAELPPIDAVPANVEARVLSLNQVFTVQAGTWSVTP